MTLIITQARSASRRNIATRASVSHLCLFLVYATYLFWWFQKLISSEKNLNHCCLKYSVIYHRKIDPHVRHTLTSSLKFNGRCLTFVVKFFSKDMSRAYFMFSFCYIFNVVKCFHVNMDLFCATYDSTISCTKMVKVLLAT